MLSKRAQIRSSNADSQGHASARKIRACLSVSDAWQVREDEAKDLRRGTRITLHLKNDAAELAEASKLGSLIKQYSEFIQFPIKLWSTKTEYEQVCPPAGTSRWFQYCPYQ